MADVPEKTEQETPPSADQAEETGSQTTAESDSSAANTADSTQDLAGTAGETEAAEEDKPASESQSGQQGPLDRILSMNVPVIIKIAEKKMTVGQVLKFHLGSVVQFEQDADQRVKLMINNSTIGLGQAIKIGENFGLRITQIGEITKTIKSLGGQISPES